MLSRRDVYNLIDLERTYQDGTYPPLEAICSDRTRQERDLDAGSGITLLTAYVYKATAAWVSRRSQLAALQYIAKIAAIAVRILENAGGSEDLLTTGLR